VKNNHSKPKTISRNSSTSGKTLTLVFLRLRCARSSVDRAEEVALKIIKPEIASDKKTIKRFSNELKFVRLNMIG